MFLCLDFKSFTAFKREVELFSVVIKCCTNASM